MMTGNGVMHNGTTTVDDYGQNLDKLKVGTKSIYIEMTPSSRRGGTEEMLRLAIVLLW